MPEKKIVINVDETGRIDAETFNFEGIDCLETLDKLLKDLALETNTTKKPEFFKNNTQTENIIKVKK